MKTWFTHTKSLASATVLAGALLAGPALIEGAVRSADVSLSFAGSVHAQAQEKQTRRLPGISEKVFKGLGKVSELASPDLDENPNAKPNFPEAYKELKDLEKKCAECNNYEKSQIYNMYAFVTYQLEKYDEAVEWYKKVVSMSPEIPIGVELQSMMYIAQLSFQLEKFDQSIDYLNRWMKLANETGNEVGPEIWQLKAVICYQSDQKKCAFESINNAISMVEGRGKIAEESWYNLQRALYLDREDYKNATVILEKMLRHYPKKSYWTQIGSMYGLLEREKDQLHAMDTAYMMGAFTKEKDLVNLSYLYMAEQVPYRAAQILQDGMDKGIVERNEKNLETLAIALQTSKELKEAIPVLREVGKMSKSGNYYGQLTSVYLDLNQPEEAIKAGRLALQKGNFTRGVDGEVYINMGIAYFDTRQYGKAIESFQNAAKIKKHARFARSWLRYAENEKKRYDGLKKALAGLGLDIEQVIN